MTSDFSHQSLSDDAHATTQDNIKPGGVDMIELSDTGSEGASVREPGVARAVSDATRCAKNPLSMSTAYSLDTFYETTAVHLSGGTPIP